MERPASSAQIPRDLNAKVEEEKTNNLRKSVDDIIIDICLKRLR